MYSTIEPPDFLLSQIGNGRNDQEPENMGPGSAFISWFIAATFHEITQNDCFFLYCYLTTSPSWELLTFFANHKLAGL